eukprot:m.362079 g.362079  ORF g.362079 m.362079 type:complete len:73 (+) comp28061_c0_seq5:167-385(+)
MTRQSPAAVVLDQGIQLAVLKDFRSSRERESTQLTAASEPRRGCRARPLRGACTWASRFFRVGFGDLRFWPF